MSNRIHLNCAFERGENGSITKSSVMVNLFEWIVPGAINLYREILKELSEEAPIIVSRTISNPSNQKPERKIEFLTAPECPDHKVPMVMRTRKSDRVVFFGCPMLYKTGCKRTAQHPIQGKDTKIPSMSSFER